MRRTMITGATSGLGEALLSRLGATDMLIGVGRDPGALVRISKAPGVAEAIACDLSDPAACSALFEGRTVDVLVNNAGISQRHQFEDIDYATWQETWQRIVDTNLTGPSNLCFCAAKKMIARGGGKIVNVSSRGAFRGEPLMPWYGASKAGLNAMGQSLAQALGPKGVFVYTVAPGFVETEMAAATLASPEGDNIRNQSSMGRVAQPEEIASTIGFLAFEAPQFMTGCIIDVNGASYLRS